MVSDDHLTQGQLRFTAFFDHLTQGQLTKLRFFDHPTQVGSQVVSDDHATQVENEYSPRRAQGFLRVGLKAMI